MAQQWYWMQGGQKHGPIETAGLKELARNGQLKPTDLIWREGLPNWVSAAQAKGLFPAQTSVPTAPPSPTTASPKPAVSAETVASPFSPAESQKSAKGTQSGGGPSNQERGAIFDAVSEGDAVAVQSLLDSRPELVKATHDKVTWNDERDKRDGKKWDATPLHWAAWHGFGRIAEVLIARGAAVNAKDNDGKTPLHNLGFMGFDEEPGDDGPHRVADLLLAHGAAANAKDKNGETPLHHAVTNPILWKTVDLLLARGANAKARDKDGVTPLHEAVLYGGNGRPEDVKRIVSSLIAAGADINAGTVAGETQTPLNWALQDAEKWRDKPDCREDYMGALAIVEYLDAHGASDGYGEAQGGTTGTACSEHPGSRVVAMCSNGCGRALCVNCANAFKPPTCSTCAHTINAQVAAYASEERGRLIKKIIVNALFLTPYILFLGGTREAWILIPILVWGFIGFRWLLNAFTSVTGLVIFARLKSWGWAFLFGSVLCGAFGFIIIPLLIGLQSIQLYRMRSNNKAIKTVAVAIPLLCIGALIIASQLHFAIESRPGNSNTREVGVVGRTNDAENSDVTSGNPNATANRGTPVVPRPLVGGGSGAWPQPSPGRVELRPQAPPPRAVEVSGTVALPQYDWDTSRLTHSLYRNEKAGLQWWLEQEVKDNPTLRHTLEALAEVIQKQADGCGTTINEYAQRGETLWAAGAYTTTHKWASGEEYRNAKEEDKKGTARGFICCSSDNGKTWVRQWFSENTGPEPVYGIYFSDASEGWALTINGILHTKNKGASWEKILECEGYSISNLFIVSKTKLVVTEARPFLHFYSSGDRGGTWDKTSMTREHKQEMDDLQKSMGGTVHYGGIYSKE